MLRRTNTTSCQLYEESKTVKLTKTERVKQYFPGEGKWGSINQGVQSLYKIKPRDLLYSMVPTVNNTVLLYLNIC